MKRVQLWLVLLALTAPLSSQVLINETYTGTEDAFELINLGSTTVSLTGWPPVSG